MTQELLDFESLKESAQEMLESLAEQTGLPPLVLVGAVTVGGKHLHGRSSETGDDEAHYAIVCVFQSCTRCRTRVRRAGARGAGAEGIRRGRRLPRSRRRALPAAARSKAQSRPTRRRCQLRRQRLQPRSRRRHSSRRRRCVHLMWGCSFSSTQR